MLRSVIACPRGRYTRLAPLHPYPCCTLFSGSVRPCDSAEVRRGDQTPLMRFAREGRLVTGRMISLCGVKPFLLPQVRYWVMKIFWWKMCCFSTCCVICGAETKYREIVLNLHVPFPSRSLLFQFMAIAASRSNYHLPGLLPDYKLDHTRLACPHHFSRRGVEDCGASCQ